MRNLFLLAAISLAATTISYGQGQGQGPVIDTHPGATIYVYDPQSGQEALAESDDAILFKDALVELVSNTAEARNIAHSSPGHKSILVTQEAPTQGNAYQIEMDSKLYGQTNVLYTFSYSVDENTLYYLDQGSNSWVTERIAEGNMVHLNDSYNLGRFNDPQNWNTPTDDGTGDTPVQASTPPPPLQEYDQPECPVDGYLWQPGYWAYNNNSGYYWVRGVWVAPPNPGYLWTPPYWGYEGGIYAFHSGYWGVSIGFYGGINYGYGYGGRGFYGGVWQGGYFRYNTAVVRVNVNVVHNTYVDRTVIVNNTTVVNNKKVSFNGPGGAEAKPTPEEVKVASQPHVRDVSQDPKAPQPTTKPFVTRQRGTEPTTAPVIKTPTAGTPAPTNTQKIPATPNNTQKTPATSNNTQKTPATGNTSKVTGIAGGTNVPKVPVNGPARGGGQNKGNRQPAKNDSNPPSSTDRKKPNN